MQVIGRTLGVFASTCLNGFVVFECCRFHYTIDVVLAIIIWIALDFAGLYKAHALSKVCGIIAFIWMYLHLHRIL